MSKTPETTETVQPTNAPSQKRQLVATAIGVTVAGVLGIAANVLIEKVGEKVKNKVAKTDETTEDE